MVTQVKSIEIINGEHWLRYSVGDELEYSINNEFDDAIIAKITDASMEYENSYVSMYLFYNKHGKLMKSIENCPVNVTYL